MAERTVQFPRHSVETIDPPTELDTDPVDRHEAPTSEMYPVRDGEPSAVYPVEPTSSRAARLKILMGASTGVWIGLVLVAAGFVAIFYSWGKVAGVVNVAQQLPYMVSGGISGLALVIVGCAVVDVAVRRQDSFERTHQLAQITRILDELRGALEDAAEDGDPTEWVDRP